MAAAALRDCGIDPRPHASGGGSDASVFESTGLRCLNVANGTEANHTPEEMVTEAAIVEMLGVCEAAIEEAAQVVTTAGGG